MFILESWPILDVARSWTEPILYEDYTRPWNPTCQSMSRSTTTITTVLSIGWLIDFKGKDYCGALILKPPKQVVLTTYILSETGYFGNEASEGTIYCSAAIVLQIHAAEDRNIASDSDSDLDPSEGNIQKPEPELVNTAEHGNVKAAAKADDGGNMKRQRLAAAPDTSTGMVLQTPQVEAAMSSSSKEPSVVDAPHKDVSSDASSRCKAQIVEKEGEA